MSTNMHTGALLEILRGERTLEPGAMNVSEIFLIAILIIFAIPYLAWRLGRTEYYAFVFNPTVVQSLNGIAWWAVMCFVWLAGIDIDLKNVWLHRRETGITAGLVAYEGWVGPKAATWQFILGVGMSCAVTALPNLVLFLEKLAILRGPTEAEASTFADRGDGEFNPMLQS